MCLDCDSVMRLHYKRTYDAQHMKRALMQFADDVGPDQRANLCSQIWTFSAR